MSLHLNLGSGRLEKMDPAVLKSFNENWVHLGEPKLRNPKNKPLSNVDYSRVKFIPFHYGRGSFLPFKNEAFTFLFSEHFFEHLFLDEAIELFAECNRVLCEGGIIRTVVPDADLRPVPEIMGYPSDAAGYDCPSKHKTRWSVYSLKPILEISGFKVNPVKFYNWDKTLVDKSNVLNTDFYQGCPDRVLAEDLSFIKRRNSLIVDGIKWKKK